MKKLIAISIIIIYVLVGVSWVSLVKSLNPISFLIPIGWQKPVYNFKANPLTTQGFELGKKLFYDGQLSKDGNFSCASCHQQFGAFSTFDHNLSHGFNNGLTTRNAPALQNLAWQENFMADGGINHLDVLFLAPLTAPNEMAETIENVVAKLKKDTAYKRLFKASFGDELINTQRIGKALSQFLVLLVSNNSKYDKVMRGEEKFNLPQQLGYAIFKQKCATCHTEPMFTDYSFRNTGLEVDNTLKDYGRQAITQNKKDSLKFRVPSLRNVAVTAPYGHDGRFFSLSNVFDHYKKNMIVSATTDSILLNKLPLSNYEIGQLTAFLYTLTDTTFLKDKRFAPEGYEVTPNFIHYH